MKRGSAEYSDVIKTQDIFQIKDHLYWSYEENVMKDIFIFKCCVLGSSVTLFIHGKSDSFSWRSNHLF